MSVPGGVNFPTSLDTAVTLLENANNAATTLTADPGAGGTTFAVTATADFPSSGVLTVEQEIVTYTGKTGTSFTGVTRAREGTSAAAHAIGAVVENRITARYTSVLRDALIAVQAKLGIGADTPAVGDVFQASAAGASAWGPLQVKGPRPFADVTHPAYGADPTGVANSSTAIQLAIDAMAAVGGGVVFFPPGTYKINAYLNLASYVHLVGSGISATKLNATANNIPVIRAWGDPTQLVGFKICDLSINGFGTPASGHNGIHVYNCSTFWIERVFIDGLEYGIYGDDSGGCWIDHVRCTNNTLEGLRMRKTSGAVSNNNWINLTNSEFNSNDRHGFHISDADGIKVLNVVCSSNADKGWLYGQEHGPCGGSFFKNVDADSNLGNQGELVDVHSSTFSGCWFGGVTTGGPTPDGLRIQRGGGNTFSNCVVTNARGNGVRMTASQATVFQGCIIVNNTNVNLWLDGNGTDGYCVDCTIANNIVAWDNAPLPTDVAGSDQGILEVANCQRNIFVGNVVYGNTSQQMNLQGTGQQVLGNTPTALTNRLAGGLVLGGTLVGPAFSRGATVLNPTTGTTVMVWRAPFAATVTNVRAHFKGGTSIVYNARKNQASNHLASNATQSTADAWGDGGAVQNAAYAAGDDLEIMIVTVNGAVTEAAVQVDFVRA